MHKKLKDLIKHVGTGIPVLTVNTRLSRYICRQYDEEMKAAGNKAWQTPLIMPLPSWIEALWNECWPEESLISRVRSNSLWEKIVLKDDILTGKEVLMTHGVVGAAYDAYLLIEEYNISFPREDIYLTEEAKAFRRWKNIYDKELKRLGFIDHASLTERIIKLIKEDKIVLPKKIIIAGFDEITPKIESFIAEIKENGCRVDYWPDEPVRSGLLRRGSKESIFEISASKTDINVRAYSDEKEEVIQAARWIRKVIKPGIRIGVIVPEMNRYRKIIKQEFTAELDPDSVFPWEEGVGLFNISMGSKLYEEPIIKSAIDILSVKERNGIDTISSILHSPFLHTDEDEYLALTRLDADLKQMNYLNISLAQIIKRISFYDDSRHDLSGFRAKLERWARILKKNEGRELPSFWAVNFSTLLKELGWPSLELENSEYQALTVWNELLEGLQSLDDILGKINRREALRHLTRIAKSRVHQPESPDCSIQVLGTLEASGQFFDHIWIIGAHEYAFPGQPSPNPFIPRHLQKKNDLSHSSSEREFAFSKVVLKRLLNSAQAVIVSYPEIVDEKEVRLSPLFDLSERQKGELIIHDNCRLKDTVHSKKAFEEMPYEENIPIEDDERQLISGGVSILKNQSACPFKAFATHRLNASTIVTPEPGLSPADRGTIVHAALRNFWKALKNSRKLKEGPLNNDIKKAVCEAIDGHHLSRLLPEKYIELERDRVELLVSDWIKLESERDDFEVIDVECEKEITIGKLVIKTRFDRIDRLDNGSEVIIDYKTGVCSRKDWFTERPKDPQLLLYNLSGSFDAIAFAQVKTGNLKFIGISKYDDMLPGVKSLDNDKMILEILEDEKSWDELISMWRHNIDRLAESFLCGDAKVDPNDYLDGHEKPCKYCDLTPLCRIFEIN
ncbi:MAG: PD-(D/E)XK nuclease family protein [Thermodesulfobacteriota bacterium]